MHVISQISICAGLLGAGLLAMTGPFLTYEVVARYFFTEPTIWAAEISQLCLIWGCLLSMAWVLTLRHHITVNALTGLLPTSFQKVCVGIALVVIIAFSSTWPSWWCLFPPTTKQDSLQEPAQRGGNRCEAQERGARCGSLE